MDPGEWTVNMGPVWKAFRNEALMDFLRVMCIMEKNLKIIALSLLCSWGIPADGSRRVDGEYGARLEGFPQ
jgi:hypothetical protein